MISIGLEVTAAVQQGAGIGRYVRELLKALVALAPQNPDLNFRLFYAATQARYPLPPLPAAFRLRVLPCHDIWLARIWQRARLPLPVELLTGRVQVYHSPDFTLPPTLPKVPTLLTVHDLSFVRDPDSAAPGLRHYLNQVVPRSVRRATHILADSAATQADLQALYHTPAEKITVLYSGVEASFQPVRDVTALAALRNRYRLGSQPFVLAVSTLQPRKNFLRLIQAFDQGLRDSPYNLVIAGGKGWLYDDIFAEVTRRGLNERVLFVGFVQDADLPALYSAATAFAYPSLYEGFGLPLLEAMACGTPVLSSTVSCLPEVAGDAALLVDPYDVTALAVGLQRIVTDAGLRAQLLAAGSLRAQQFRWQQSAQQLLAVYRGLAGVR
jgi:glycosyltransferase involved in cell wall biosynthesis